MTKGLYGARLIYDAIRKCQCDAYFDERIEWFIVKDLCWFFRRFCFLLFKYIVFIYF